jgi:hypothetical protein
MRLTLTSAVHAVAGSRRPCRHPLDLAVLPTAIGCAVAAALAAAPLPARAAALRFTTCTVTDPQFGGMRVGTFSVPQGWQVSSRMSSD